MAITNKTISVTGVQSIGVASYDQSLVSTMLILVSGITGSSMTPRSAEAVQGSGVTQSTPDNCAYSNYRSGASYAAGTAITADGLYAIPATASEIFLNVTAVNTPYTVRIIPLEGVDSGVGGGGPVTIADGADVTLGAKADAASTDATSTNTAMSFFKGIVKILNDAWNSTSHFFRVTLNDGTNSVAIKAASTAAGATDPALVVSVSPNSALPAGEAHVGQIGGTTTNIAPTLAVTAAAYSAGNCVGGLLTLTNAMRISGGSGAWAKLNLTDHANQKAPLDILLFKSSPAGTFTDKSAFPTMTAADNALVSSRISVAVGDWVTVGGSAYCTKVVGPLPVTASGSANLYAAMNTSGTPTYAATTDLSAIFGFFCD